MRTHLEEDGVVVVDALVHVQHPVQRELHEVEVRHVDPSRERLAMAMAMAIIVTKGKTLRQDVTATGKRRREVVTAAKSDGVSEAYTRVLRVRR